MEFPEKLRMNAYYYSFEETGVRAIDEILSAVAMAGKGLHDTDNWANEAYGPDGYSYASLIQEKANNAAKQLDPQGKE